ncbi:MAG: thermonuclease family protein [Kiritimatiellae bacterium]|nr:thermonuclease family protein [Kiritimatiellia bacterium]
MKTAIRLFLALAGTSVFAASAAGQAWETREGCRLAADDANDADSFRVSRGTEEFRVRLYWVDACETSWDFPDRVKEQAAYFGITPARALLLGKEASRRTEDFLRGGFAVAGRGENAGNGRTYANVTAGEGDLGEMLVAAGLARIHGKHDGSGKLRNLLVLEENAKRAGLGGWRSEEAWQEAERAAAERTKGLLAVFLLAALALALYAALPVRRRRK